MYRFRKTCYLLEDKYQELKKQEIFLSDITSLNDPMEGFYNFIWKGDSIVWSNFLKHYLFCLNHLVILANLSEDEEMIKEISLPVYGSEELFKGKLIAYRFVEICVSFFENSTTIDLISYLTKRDTALNREEVFCLLKLIHLIALDIIIQNQVKHGLTKNFKPLPKNALYTELIRFLSTLIHELSIEYSQIEQKFNEAFYPQLKNKLLEQDINLLTLINDLPDKNKKRHLFVEFSNMFLDQITKIIYPDYYVACFTNNPLNASIWGHYGDGQKGVCLNFKTQKLQNREIINLEMVTSVNSDKEQKDVFSRSFRPIKLQKMEYTNQFPSIDFFRSIGQIPQHQVITQWYTDKSGNKSSCGDHFENRELVTVWQKAYWDSFVDNMNKKMKDWEYEEEYRIFQTNSVIDISLYENRKLRYKFEDLDSIIFGIRTPLDDKLKIIDIIKKKCIENKRDSFDFYQANYSSFSGQMEFLKININVQS
jgi:hypothetical protein